MVSLLFCHPPQLGLILHIHECFVLGFEALMHFIICFTLKG